MRRSVAIPVGLLLIWWVAAVIRSFNSRTEAPSIPAENRAPVSSAGKPAAKSKVIPPAARSPAADSSKSQKGTPAMPRPFEYPIELATYLDLQAKVFLNANEQQEKESLLRHTGFMRALGNRLKEGARTPDSMREQDAAIDVLVEALRSGDATVAGEILRDVVQDGQVEDVSLDRNTREQLAGLKAEVLYQWSAMTPGMANTLQAWLPGPISQRIWTNVLRMQNSNIAESTAESRSSSH